MSSFLSISSDKLFRQLVPPAPVLVDVRIDEDRAVYLRTHKTASTQEPASTRGTLGTTIKWRIP